MYDLELSKTSFHYSDVHCVCCPEKCRSFMFYPTCNPLKPSRPDYHPEREKRIVYSAVPQMDLFGGAL